MTISVKSLQKQLLAAIAMVLVATIALGSSTYAWFVSNNTVKATTSTISAQSNAPFLMIDKTAITASSSTAISFTDVDSKPLYPAQVVKDTAEGAYKNKPLFKSAYASASNATTELTNSRYDVAHVGELDSESKEIVVNAEFAIKESFKIGTADAKAGSFKDLKVSKVELTSNGSAGLEAAMSVLVVCGDNWAVYKKSNDGAVLTTYNDGVSAVGVNNGILAATIDAATSVNVDVYVFYDGSETNVYTDNLANLTAIGATITFTATPVNTQGVDVNATNSTTGTAAATVAKSGNDLTVSVANAPGDGYVAAYSWAKDGSPVSGATNATLTLSSDSDNGSYTCTVTYTKSGAPKITVTSNPVAATYAP